MWMVTLKGRPNKLQRYYWHI